MCNSEMLNGKSRGRRFKSTPDVNPENVVMDHAFISSLMQDKNPELFKRSSAWLIAKHPLALAVSAITHGEKV